MTEFKKIDPEAIRRGREIDRAVDKETIGTGVAIAIEYGTGVFLQPKCEDAIITNFRAARIRALKGVGVLDENGAIIPGQEFHAQRHGFLPEVVEATG